MISFPRPSLIHDSLKFIDVKYSVLLAPMTIASRSLTAFGQSVHWHWIDNTRRVEEPDDCSIAPSRRGAEPVEALRRYWNVSCEPIT